MEFLNNTAEGKGRAPLESIALNIMPGGLKSAMELLLLVILWNFTYTKIVFPLTESYWYL